MSAALAYTTFLCDDSDTEEVQALESEMKSLIRRKFELECQLYVPRPRKFKEIESVAQAPKTYGNINEWDLSNLEMKMHFNKLCGIYVTDVDNGINVCFNTSHGVEGYFICLKEEEASFTLDKYHLPPIVPIKDLCNHLLISKKELYKFCHKIFHFIIVFEDRLRQIQDIKKNSFENIELFSSHSTEYVKIEINIVDAVGNIQKISVHLQYRSDFIFPQKISVDCPGIEGEEKAELAEKCQVFQSMTLLEAIRTALLPSLG